MAQEGTCSLDRTIPPVALAIKVVKNVISRADGRRGRVIDRFHGTRATYMGQPATILVVDDESPITYMLGFKLRQRGYQILTAGDGDEGFELACKHLPDLIISDFQMPQMSGLEMCTRLRAFGPTAGIPLIMLTARAHRVSEAELAKIRVCCLIDKPFSTKILLAKIVEILASKAALPGGQIVG